MGSKRFKGKTCAYCCTPESSTTGDHVIARAFFLPEHRNNLPQVPACGRCNGEKSVLEHYLAAVLPFGARYAHARPNMEQVVGRLENNRQVHNELLAGRRWRWSSINGGPFMFEPTLPLQGKKLVELLRLIVRGLAYHEYGLLLPIDQHCVEAAFMVPNQVPAWEQLLALRGEAIERDLGEQTFRYHAVLASDGSEVTVWRLQFYDGMRIEGAEGSADVAYGFTAPNASPLIRRLAAYFRGEPFPDG